MAETPRKTNPQIGEKASNRLEHDLEPSSSLSESESFPIEASFPQSEGRTFEIALNVADIGHQKNLLSNIPEVFNARLSFLCDDAASRFGQNSIQRIYIGSYFCDRFFLSLDDGFFEACAEFCRYLNLKITLVVPIFGQATLSSGRDKVEALINRYGESEALIDEVVANDPAMADLLASLLRKDGPLHISYGRMMAKSPRDPRHAVLSENAWPYALDAKQAQSIKEGFGYTLAECDPTTPFVDVSALNDALPLALHLPHCFMTTGHICEAASIGVSTQYKFRADMPCRQQCLECVQVYEHHDYESQDSRWFTRFGRTVFFENPTCELEGALPQRIIWTPADFINSSPSPANQASATSDASYSPGFYPAWPQMDYSPYPTDQSWPTDWSQAYTQGGQTWE